jgi:hypothetical protein
VNSPYPRSSYERNTQRRHVLPCEPWAALLCILVGSAVSWALLLPLCGRSFSTGAAGPPGR